MQLRRTTEVRNRVLSLNKFFIPVVLVLFVLSCKSRVIYNEYQSIPETGWHCDSVQNFTFQITDTVRLYDITFNFRHRAAYPYRNCWIFTRRMQPDSLIFNDTTEFFPADEQGNWLGVGLGSVYDFPAAFKKNYRFRKAGTYHYQLRHGLRDTILTGIREVGLKISLADGQE